MNRYDQRTQLNYQFSELTERQIKEVKKNNPLRCSGKRPARKSAAPSAMMCDKPRGSYQGRSYSQRVGDNVYLQLAEAVKKAGL